MMIGIGEESLEIVWVNCPMSRADPKTLQSNVNGAKMSSPPMRQIFTKG
jgi:hypothetical protein